MKILYGVQGTGNGHITRARAMQKELAQSSIEVDYLFSGRKPSDYFDLDCFNPKTFRKGLTFAISNGTVNYFKTAFVNNIFRFFQDIKQLNMTSYDAVITDFEPISARCGKKAGIPVFGIGHQYVFDCNIPKAPTDYFSQRVLKHYAPAQRIIPLHWHHFNQDILPPILESDTQFTTQVHENLVVVYLPFENQNTVLACLKPLSQYQFIIYAPHPVQSDAQHITFKPLSRLDFLQDLHRCETVIANAGFELSSESLKLGKKLIVKPLSQQMEQQSNAIALKQLGYGCVLEYLDSEQILTFLTDSTAVQIEFPNVARYIVNWAQQGFAQRDSQWYQQAWQQVTVTSNIYPTYQAMPVKNSIFSG